jgi:hypothetical protein
MIIIECPDNPSIIFDLNRHPFISPSGWQGFLVWILAIKAASTYYSASFWRVALLVRALPSTKEDVGKRSVSPTGASKNNLK